jgi:hypothetical protein
MNQAQRAALRDPSWWLPEHSSAWERSKAALRRDWEQTKADLGSGGTELSQSVGDTLRQATGKEVIPPPGFANSPEGPIPRDAWADAESAVRYGCGARKYYSDAEWDDELEQKLRQDWENAPDQSSWAQVRHAVRRGWDGIQDKH